MSDPIISVSGLRGTIGSQLTPLVACRYAAALAATLPRGVVILGRDGRSSGALLAAAVTATLQASGMDVIDLGPAATPTVGVQVRAQSAVGGIQISASHNPKEYNGLKLFGSDGRVLPKHVGEQVLNGYKTNQQRWVDVDALGQIKEIADPHAAHLKLVLSTVDVRLIQSKRFRVLLDANHGAGALLGRRLLESLGCQVTVLGEQPHGQFWHKPEPLAENLVDVCRQAANGSFDVGFCQDPDADRLAVTDQQGRFIGEELTLALCLLQALPQLPPGGCVVTNCATSSVSRFVAEKFGQRLVQSAVGEANVADAMIAEQAVFGGEGNGGPIDPAVGFVRDSFVGMARILQLLATTGQTISQLVATLPPLAMVKDKVDMSSEHLPRLFDAISAQMKAETLNRLDGLKLEWADRWLLVRGSNTEPIVRFMAEAPTLEQARQLCDAGINVARQLQ